jgi:hypothetical protein
VNITLGMRRRAGRHQRQPSNVDWTRIDWKDLYPRLLLVAQGKLHRLTWRGKRWGGLIPGTPTAHDFVQAAILKTMDALRLILQSARPLAERRRDWGMKAFLAMVPLVFVTATANAGGITAYELQQKCVKALPSEITELSNAYDAGYCLGFIAGAPVTCFPANVTTLPNGVGLDIFLAWARRFPQYRYMQAREAVVAAFNAAYGCTNPAATQSGH